MRHLLIVFSILAFCLPAFTEELGETQIKGLFIEPEFSYLEDQKAQVNIDRWAFGFLWDRDESISAYLRVGPKGLNHRPRYFENSDEPSEISIIEGHGIYRSSLGEFRFGLITLPFSFESQLDESKRWFPKSLLAKNGFYGRRDLGLFFKNSYSGFHTLWAAHGGESGADLDEQFWLTAQWYFQDSKGFVIGFSGQTGRTKTTSTNPSGTRAGILGFEVDEDARLRAGNFFVAWQRPNWRMVLEASMGEVLQASEERQWHSFRGDFVYEVIDHVDVLFRFDSLEQDNKTSDSVLKEWTLGFSLNSENKTSKFFVLALRKEFQGDPQADHQALILWRLTPEISF